MSHLFWLAATGLCLLWYSTITAYVAVKGAVDIVVMLRVLSEPADRPPVD